MQSDNAKLSLLFPIPSTGPSPLSPIRIPGATNESNDALLRILKEDYRRWHCFFNDEGMHNHASHHMVAIYAMGANATLLDAAYQTHVVYMRPAFSSPGLINEDSFYVHLGDEEYYTAYLQFFAATVLADGVSSTMQKYIFSRAANVGVGDAQPPFMLARFLATVFHPMIHIGNGVEFGLLGLVAEGLAQAAIHPPHLAALYPLSMWDEAGKEDQAVTALAARFSHLPPSLVLNKVSATDTQDQQSVRETHAFNILARILHDDRFNSSAIGLPIPEEEHDHELTRTERVVGDLLVKYVQEWTVDGTDERDVARKIEELSWIVVLLYGVGGWGGRTMSDTGKFNADFFLMHLVTSSIFLPSLVAYLTPKATSLLLRTYFTASLTWWVAVGRPDLPIRDFFASVTAAPRPPNEPHVVSARDTLTPEDPTPNPWLAITQTTLVHPGEHVCKLQRALMHFADLYGARPKGHFAMLAKGTDPAAHLEGVEELDGTLFVRTAGLTAEKVGWMREGQQAALDWDRAGFYKA
ncbi:hypothetical protein OBBRIDRAFT_739946 [Obba rivulosa]|uniref:Oxidoreductase AflY n=1 Tax=Obba rivulosa TaxID=1052685 RepID=A0A8E2DEY6_9APHY|nr:hypothetical protein OBBRIDRAFT_739946 [Obba rivulosa]